MTQFLMVKAAMKMKMKMQGQPVGPLLMHLRQQLVDRRPLLLMHPPKQQTTRARRAKLTRQLVKLG